MMLRDELRDIVEMLFLAGIFVRNASTQLGYFWVTGYHPECRDAMVLRARPSCDLTRIEPWAVYYVHLASTAVALTIPMMGYAMEVSFAGFPTLLGAVAWSYLAANWVFVLAFDPLVLALRGPERPTDMEQEVSAA